MERLSPKKRCANLEFVDVDKSKRYGCYIFQGKPTPQARPRFGNGRCWDDQKQLREQCSFDMLVQHKPASLYKGALLLKIYFFMPTPKKKASNQHIVKPDLSNLIKFVEDSANGILFADDKQIVEIYAKKIYSENPRTELIIVELGE